MPSGRPTAAHKERKTQVRSFGIPQWRNEPQNVPSKAPKHRVTGQHRCLLWWRWHQTIRFRKWHALPVATLLFDAYPFDERRQRGEPTTHYHFFQTCVGSWKPAFPAFQGSTHRSSHVVCWSAGPNIFQQNSSRPDAHLQPPAYEYDILHQRETNWSQKTEKLLECLWKLLFVWEGLTGLQLLAYLFLFDVFRCQRSWGI